MASATDLGRAHNDPEGATSSPAGASSHGLRAREHRRVLVVDDDRGIVDLFTMALDPLQLEIVPALAGTRAVAVAQQSQFDLMLVDLELPDMTGLDIVRVLRSEGVHVPFILVSGHATVSIAVQAMTLGALNVLEKPVDPTELCTVVRCAITQPALEVNDEASARTLDSAAPVPRPRPLPTLQPRTVAERWAAFVLSVVRSDHDPKTMSAWAKGVGVSRSVLCECCRLVHVPPHDARDFARMLRAVYHCADQWTPETVLDFADARTLSKLEARGGLTGRRETPAPTVEDFLERQQWIPADNPGLLMLRAVLIGDGSKTN